MKFLIAIAGILVWFRIVHGDVVKCCQDNTAISNWGRSWRTSPITTDSWSLDSRAPMSIGYEESRRAGKGKFKVKKKLKRFLLPLLLAYKLKFFTLIPVLIGGLLLLTGATGLAGFFFALFAAVMGLKSGGGHK